MPDVIVIGAGVAGSACARELARFDLDVLVLEASNDVAHGASRTNSGIVHGGYDPVPGTLKARYNALGARMIPVLSKELGFRYWNNGSMVVALSEAEMDGVRELARRADANGIDGVRVVSGAEALELEPNLNPSVVGALVCDESGICDPFGMTVAFAENAVTNGVEFRFLSPVESVERDGGGWAVTLAGGERIACRAVVNAAGAHAIELHNQVSANTLEARPRLGEYVLMNRETGITFGHTMFRAPGPKGKGVLVSPTVEGNLIVGPNAVDVSDPDDTATSPEGLTRVIEQAKLTWPGYDARAVITNFAGVRPTGADGDFVVGEPDDAPGFFDVAAFDSPGISSAPAVAADVAGKVAERLGAAANESFDPHRDMPPRFLEMTEEERAAAVAADPRFGHIVCRCETVSEAEILAAIHAPIPATTVTGVKRRCRSGMGGCQGGFCGPSIAEMISAETGVSLEEVLVAGPGSEMAPFRRGERLDD